MPGGYFTPGGRYYDADANFFTVQPGAQWSYSNVAVALVGLVVQNASNQPFEEFCQVLLMQPCGSVTFGCL